MGPLKNGTGCEIRDTRGPIGRLDHARTSNKLRPWPGVPPLYSFWAPGSGGTYSYLTATQERRRQRNATAGPRMSKREALSSSLFSRFSSFPSLLLSPSFHSSSRSCPLRVFPSFSPSFFSFSPPLRLSCIVPRSVVRSPPKLYQLSWIPPAAPFSGVTHTNIDDRPLFFFRPGPPSKFRPGCSSVQVEAAGDQWEIGERSMEKIRGRNLATGASGNDYN